MPLTDGPSFADVPTEPRSARLLRAIGWFIPEAEGDRIDRLRAQLYVVFSGLVAANAALFGTLHTLHHLPGSGRTVIYVLAVVCGASLVFPFLLKAGAPLRVMGPGFMAFFQTGVVAVAGFDGGFASGAMYWLIVTPLAAAFMGGARLGWSVAVTSVASGLAMYGASASGFVFPTSLSPADAAAHHTLNFVCAATLVSALAALYEGPMVRHLRGLSGRLAEANEDLRRELVERQRAQARAEAASQAKDALLANMSHEFRTPLTAILGCTEILLDEADPHHRPFLQSIGRGGQRLLVTLDGVLDLVWIESGDLGLDPDEVDVMGEVREAVEAFRPMAETKGLDLRVLGAHAVAVVDQSAFRRVVVALVDNAVRFTDEGQVTVSVAGGPDRTVVEIADTGVGISPAFLPNAFEPFRQASEGDARTHEGVGLGLTVAQRLVDRMDATMDVESAPGEGTTVRISLPVQAGPGEAASVWGAEPAVA